MDFDKIVLDKLQSKILKLLTFRDKSNLYQIHGYFHFPNFTDIALAIQDLEKLNLVIKESFISPSNYRLTMYGKKYILFLKKQRLKSLSKAIAVTASLCAVLSFILKLYNQRYRI